MFRRICIILLSLVFGILSCKTGEQNTGSKEITLTLSKKYLNLPVSQSVESDTMTFSVEGKTQLKFVIRLASGKPDYWVFYDISSLSGKDLLISYKGNPNGMKEIYQDDNISGQDSLYNESNRPQLHFTSRRGWNNDPNGLVYLDGEYHLFYQHNPFEREWENMTWGHAVSTDLVHWQELKPALWPDDMGTMFSGSAVIDYDNTSGFGKDGIPPMVAIYTVNNAKGQRQCIAYSLDKGRTFTKYEGNPVIDSWDMWKTTDLRDPDVFWYKPAKHWVMVLYEKDGMSIYNSPDLKKWEYKSHTPGFFECPNFFELPVDGNKNTKKWVMYGASGTYMIGKFNGSTFTPESGKYYYGNGVLYAAQTYNNIPEEDGRRIQIAWGRVEHPGMPFKHEMLIPTVFSLRTTKDGVRLFSEPVKEIETLQQKELAWNGTDQAKASEFMQQFNNAACLRIKTKIKLSHSTSAGLSLYGQNIILYDLNYNQINGLFYTPEDRTSMEISADIFVDKTSVEVFIDGGAFSYALEKKAVTGNTDGYKFFGKEIEIKELKVYPMKSIWPNHTKTDI
ncbi:MAG TPA: glycoside hydrolase family 32 protein [Bacteroidales bacterium]|nr:glycoside hydrolase family 32 protein [Bacteroidales bacterium]